MNVPLTVTKQSSFTYDQPKSLLQRFLKALSGHVGLLLCVSIFTIIGAYIFIEIELPNEEHRYLVKRLRAKDIDDTMGYVARLFWFEKHQNLTEKQWSKKMRITLKIMETQIINAVSEHHYDGHVQTWNYDWTFPKALLFTCSIVTTLGYGHIFPHTDAGQVFTIIYATLGIPLMLLFLARIGDLMASGFRRVYSRVCCTWCRTRRYQSEAIFGKKAKRVWEDEIGQEEYMPTNQVRVPVAILMVLMLLYLLLGAQIFSVWEGWTYIAACYFSFVTLTTIGFGDLLPGNSFFTEPDDAERAWQMVTAIVYCLLGMALVSMCLQMVQQQAADLVRWAGEELGLIDDHLRPRLRYRRSKPGSVPVGYSAPRAGHDTREEVVLLDEEPRSGKRRRKGTSSGKSGRRSRLSRQKMVMESGAGAESDGVASQDEQQPLEEWRNGGAENTQLEGSQEEGSDVPRPESEEIEEDREEEEGEEDDGLVGDEEDLEAGIQEDWIEKHKPKKGSEVDRLIEQEMNSDV